MSETPAPVSPAETQVNAISTIAAAAFGIAVGGTASAARRQGRRSNRAQRDQMKRRQASQAQAQLGDLKQTLTSLTDTPTRLPSPAGRDSFLVDSRQPEILQTLPEPIEIPASDLASVREKLASIEASLGAIAG